jgi:hypothetical protein
MVHHRFRLLSRRRLRQMRKPGRPHAAKHADVARLERGAEVLVAHLVRLAVDGAVDFELAVAEVDRLFPGTSAKFTSTLPGPNGPSSRPRQTSCSGSPP